MNMRTRIAKFIFNELARGNGTPGGKFWETAPKEVTDFCFSITDVVLAELTEPTEAMIGAVADGRYLHCDEDRPNLVTSWREMITAAAKE